MSVRFEAFKPEHLHQIEPRDQSIEGLEELHQISSMFVRGPALTAWEDEWPVPVGAGGIIVMKPGVGQAWLLASHRLFASMKMAKEIRRFMWEIIRDYDLYRVHAFADCAYPRNARFLEFLGMRLEGIHRKLGPGASDFATFAWVR